MSQIQTRRDRNEDMQKAQVELLSYVPKDRHEASHKLAYLFAFLLANRQSLSHEDIEQISTSIRRFSKHF